MKERRAERIKDRGMTLLLASCQISTGSRATSQKILNNSMTQDLETANTVCMCLCVRMGVRKKRKRVLLLK